MSEPVAKTSLRPPQTHDLKVWVEYWRDLVSGEKPFEVRKNDRDFRVGDTLRLRAWDPMLGLYMSDTMERRVTYILKGGEWGVEPGFVVMGIAP